ncbi:hypothetical protein VKS41_000342 [Umbelopsis sp. WA50703]
MTKAYSIYCAVLAFMNQSPLFSFFPQIPLIVSGVINLIFGLIGIYGFLIVTISRVLFLRTLSHVAWAGIILILSDTFANLIIFINDQSNYLSTCVDNAAKSFEHELTQAFQGISNVTLDQTADFYNCSRLWSDEVKLSILVLILMIVVYIYWGFIIWSFSQKRRILLQQHMVMQAAAMESGVPPPGPVPAELVDLPPRKASREYEDNVVVLENKKPRTRREIFSKSPLDDPYGFKIGNNGQVLGLDQMNHSYLWTSDGRPASALSAQTMYSHRSEHSRRSLVDHDKISERSEDSRIDLC